MDRCPTCQARLREGPACHRCRTDLTRLRAIEAEGASRLRQAFALLARGERAGALRVVETSLGLKRDPLAQALLGFLSASEPVTANETNPPVEVEPEVKQSPLPELAHEDSAGSEEPQEDQSISVMVRKAWQKLRVLINRP
ncbi:MAG: hypothetical protein PHE55_18700 [Methylococcaceae bacterium]|nr:hypothetical protein [Methylococcaceae bacterium]